MLYTWDITIPAGTEEADAIEEILKISKGVIVKVQIKFPSGCHGLVKCRLFRWRSQIWPLSTEEWITGDDETIDVLEYYEFTKGPYQLIFKGCSPGTDFDHKLIVRIVILPKEMASFYPLVQVLQKFLSRIFGPVEGE